MPKKLLKTNDFIKLAGVSRMAITKAVRSGRVIKEGRSAIDINNPINQEYIRLNQNKIGVKKVDAKFTDSFKTQAGLSESNDVKSKPIVSRAEKQHTEMQLSETDIKSYVSKIDLERAKLEIDTKLKQVQLSVAMRELIPTKLVKQRISNFATVLQNTVLVLPDKLTDEIVNLVLEKGKGASVHVNSLLSKSIGSAIKESKLAIDKISDYEKSMD